MREVSATDSVDEDFVSQDALKHHLAVQAAIAGGMKKAQRRKWIAAAVGLALLIVLLGALLAANAAEVWRQA